MMNQKNTIIYVVFMLLCLGGLHSQESPTAAGGEATGTGGSASYSVGQVVYTSATGTTGSVAQGVQQPFEISTIVGVEERSIHLEMMVYPNPTTDFLRLEVETQALKGLSFQLFDMHGKLLKNNSLTNNSTKIKMEEFAEATYILKITDNNKIVKSYKIIKH